MVNLVVVGVDTGTATHDMAYYIIGALLIIGCIVLKNEKNQALTLVYQLAGNNISSCLSVGPTEELYR